MAEEQPTSQWRDPTPSSSSTSLCSSVSVTPERPKKQRTEEDHDPTYQPEQEAESGSPQQGTKLPLVTLHLEFEEEQLEKGHRKTTRSLDGDLVEQI